MAITPDGKHAYVTNVFGGTVSVITTATGAVSAPITVGKSPTTVAITPDGKHAYVTNRDDSTVSVITTATGAVSAPITVSGGPPQVAITPDGKHAYVTNFRDGTVSVITTATGAVSAPITVGKYPGGVAITPDGKHAYVTNTGDGTVSVITTATGAVSAPITVGKNPVSVAITPDGKHAYVTNEGTNGAGDTVSVITTATGAVSPITVGEGPDAVAFTPDGKHAYVTNWGRTARSHGVGDHHGDGRGVGPYHRRQGSLGGGDLPDAEHPPTLTVTAGVQTPTLAARQAQLPGSTECPIGRPYASADRQIWRSRPCSASVASRVTDRRICAACTCLEMVLFCAPAGYGDGVRFAWFPCAGSGRRGDPSSLVWVWRSCRRHGHVLLHLH